MGGKQHMCFPPFSDVKVSFSAPRVPAGHFQVRILLQPPASATKKHATTLLSLLFTTYRAPSTNTASMAAEVSHGRGGAGNINTDKTEYVDGEVVRAGVEGSHDDGAYSTGRGGAGNIGDVGSAPGARRDKDVVPESAYRASQDGQDHHTGRGGAGNEHVANGHGKKAAPRTGQSDAAPVSLADRLKQKLFAAMRR
ncbi:uncharacterized protein MAM_08284 [Metarhizium album ARSEF 1941]|uniref:Uncharacterized protein n=1 Tax=Metarhizium album (strain ARSEF 1941) TaxID=1081103 RepID=A0A0B2WK67_METAS|nr:uncharacterized protein MAM_08284 [Metarhizium album ARSEF 1941]KHN93862.1 hypothetical protein MAM_08284 [Metarhizium album ARSEF 1941]